MDRNVEIFLLTGICVGSARPQMDDARRDSRSKNSVDKGAAKIWADDRPCNRRTGIAGNRFAVDFPSAGKPGNSPASSDSLLQVPPLLGGDPFPESPLFGGPELVLSEESFTMLYDQSTTGTPFEFDANRQTTTSKKASQTRCTPCSTSTPRQCNMEFVTARSRCAAISLGTSIFNSAT
jgi:hypothetical protein